MSKNSKKVAVDVTFDLSVVSAREIAPHMEGLLSGNIAPLGEILALVVTSCPAEWGPCDDPATYNNMPLTGELGAVYGALKRESLATVQKVTVKFDLANMTAPEYDVLIAKLTKPNPLQVAELLAQYVTECDVVDDVGDPEQYLNLGYYTYFAPLMNGLKEYSQAEIQNFLKRFTA